MKDIETRFDNLNYELYRPLAQEKNKNVVGLMKDELGGKIIAQFPALRPKTYSYVTNESNKNKNIKDTKNCIIKT